MLVSILSMVFVEGPYFNEPGTSLDHRNLGLFWDRLCTFPAV